MKKNIPLIILEALQPIADENTAIAHTIRDENSLFHLIDNDLKSDFYFKVSNKTENRSGYQNFLIEFKPRSKEKIEPVSDWRAMEGIARSLKTWIDIIKTYNKIQTVYDDPLIEAYQKEFLKKFEIVDEDAETAPLI